MVELLIIADDFTGALDTGVQFAASGAITRVLTNSESKIENIDESVQVLVMNAESRHLSAKDAYEIVYKYVKQANELGIPYIYKKTDSALRGNIGSELTAVIKATNEQVLHFLPALPKMNRTTRDGIHYIDNIPVHESVFGRDPFEPVIHSYIPDMVAVQSEMPVAVVKKGRTLADINEPTIAVYDVASDEELQEIALSLYQNTKLKIMAGCAGFAAVLPKLLNIEGKKHSIPEFKSRFLVICGSVNPITKSQLDYAETHGFDRIRLTPEQKLCDGYMESEEGQKAIETWKNICLNTNKCIIDTNDLPGTNETFTYAKQHSISLDQVRSKISSILGWIVKELITSGIESTIMLTGGDTLLGFMSQIKTHEMTPICEIAPGTVFSSIEFEGKSYEVISKSGGFGEESLLVTLADLIVEGKEEKAIC